MGGDDHQEQLRERIALLATLVEDAYAQAIRTRVLSVVTDAAPAPTTHDMLPRLQAGIHPDVLAYLARFRPVAADLRFATTILGCAFDLREAADAIAGVQCILDETACPEVSAAISRLTTLVHVVVCVMADAVVAWDATASGAIGVAQQEVAMVRDQMHGEIAKALVRPGADAGSLIEIDASGCLLTRISSASASCVRRLSKAAVPSRIAPTAAHARSAVPRHRAIANSHQG